MTWKNVKLIFLREVRDQLRDRRTLFMVAVLPLLLYPSLGIGLVNQLVSMNEQPRTVFVLGAKDLPDPQLFTEDGFAPHYFASSDDALKLRVVTPDTIDSLPEGDRPAIEKFYQFADRHQDDLRQLSVLQEDVRNSTSNDPRRLQQEAALREKMQPLFANGKVQILMVFPPDFHQNLTAMEARLAAGQYSEAAELAAPRPLVVHNGADDKSEIAFQRIREALRSWEEDLLQRRLTNLHLPRHLPHPVRPIGADLAKAEEFAANMWSKVFPALLVIMSVTGAFYPAIDLGAGEKERGTMETLLISPATRTEIVLGKFFTVMLFSMATALLNVASMGFTGVQMASMMGSQSPMLGDMSLPSWPALACVVLVTIPLASLFSALTLAIAMFARSSKEGQYYLSPLLMVTLGLTMFCFNPTYELDPYKSVMPVVGPSLLLKALLLGDMPTHQLLAYTVTVLTASCFYSLCALWWAIELFQREDILFRESERFDLRLWVRHLLRDKEPTPTIGEAILCFVMIAVLQFIFLTRMPAMLGPDASATAYLKVQIIYLIGTVAVPPLFMAVMLTSRPWKTLRLGFPGWGMLLVGVVLPVALQPVSLELVNSLDWFFPPMPAGMNRLMESMADNSTPLWLSFAAFAIAPAICEELAFRGFILSGLQRSRHKWVPILVSAVLFGVIHLIPKQIFNAALLGIVLGLLATRSRSLWPCMLFHVVYNGLQVLSTRAKPEWFETGVADLFFTVERSGDAFALRYDMPLLAVSGLVSAILIAGLLNGPPTTSDPSLQLDSEPNSSPA
ncbi:MAG: CPBP family intramembrane metalloprotease [Planctomycetaceae bacterium]|nr:CPBP family intramembrane metalloprotease [Planctomycetaceae bacterium]